MQWRRQHRHHQRCRQRQSHTHRRPHCSPTAAPVPADPQPIHPIKPRSPSIPSSPAVHQAKPPITPGPAPPPFSDLRTHSPAHPPDPAGDDAVECGVHGLLHRRCPVHGAVAGHVDGALQAARQRGGGASAAEMGRVSAPCMCVRALRVGAGNNRQASSRNSAALGHQQPPPPPTPHPTPHPVHPPGLWSSRHSPCPPGQSPARGRPAAWLHRHGRQDRGGAGSRCISRQGSRHAESGRLQTDRRCE